MKICLYQTARALFNQNAVQDINIPWLDLLNTENLYFDSVKPLKNIPHYVVSYERMFHYVTIKTEFIYAEVSMPQQLYANHTFFTGQKCRIQR